MPDPAPKPDPVDQPELGQGEQRRPPPIEWEPPGGLRRRPVRRGEYRPRRPR